MKPYEVLIYVENDDGSITAWGPEMIFAKDSDAAERVYLLRRAGAVEAHDPNDLEVVSRPFA